jgi:hemoglobin
MTYDTITEESIQHLVDSFYRKVRADPELGAIFEASIGTTDEAWRPHLEVMYRFWSSVMLHSGRYRGNPLRKHLELPPFDPALFDRWLALFEATAAELHQPQDAAAYIEKSRMIAANLRRMIEGMRAETGDELRFRSMAR